jgi:hypothetical protein
VSLVFQRIIAKWVLGLEKLLLFTLRTTWLICGFGAVFLSLSMTFQEWMKAPMQKLGFARASAVYQDYFPGASPSQNKASGFVSNAQDPNTQAVYEVDTVSVNGFLFGCSFINSVPVIGPVIMPALGVALGHEWAEHQT